MYIVMNFCLIVAYIFLDGQPWYPVTFRDPETSRLQTSLHRKVSLRTADLRFSPLDDETTASAIISDGVDIF